MNEILILLLLFSQDGEVKNIMTHTEVSTGGVDHFCMEGTWTWESHCFCKICSSFYYGIKFNHLEAVVHAWSKKLLNVS